MRLGRKAEITLVVALASFLASTVVLIGFVGVVMPALKEATDKELCKLSVQAKYAPSIITGKESGINLQCYTQTLEMRYDGIYKSGKKRAPVRIDNTYHDTDKNYQKKEKTIIAIANEMYDCWDQFHQGKLNIFRSVEKRCVICTDLVFHTDWLNKGEGEVPLIIGDFINENIIPGTEITYANYFGGRFDSDFSVDPTQKTQIVFKALEKSWLTSAAVGEVGGCVAGAVVGAKVGGVIFAVGGPIGWVAGPVAFLTSYAGGCLIGWVAGKDIALDQEIKGGKNTAAEQQKKGDEWVASMVVGPEILVSRSSCDRLY